MKKVKSDGVTDHVHEIPVKRVLKELSQFNMMGDLLTSFKDNRDFDRFTLFQIMMIGFTIAMVHRKTFDK